MERMDRMSALVEELRAAAPERRTARWLARRFDVPVHTVERDLRALREAGVPVVVERGPGGGYGLHEAEPLPPLHLTAAEATAAAVALERLSGSPLELAARSLLRKLHAVMPGAEVERAESFTARVQVVGSVRPPAPVPRALADAVGAGRVLELDYVDEHGSRSTRLVEPTGYTALDEYWYLEAYCRMRGHHRKFRLDRIHAVTVTDEPVSVRAEPDPDESGLADAA